MKINRRELLAAGGLFLVPGARPLGKDTGAPSVRQQTQAAPSPSERLLAALQRNRLPLTIGDAPAGRGWDWLVQEAKGARFTLIGEEHGVAETAQLSAALFKALHGSGYNRVAVELSPAIAQDVEAAARRDGLKGVVDLLTTPTVFTFSNVREEAQFLADVVRTGPGKERVLHGIDREIFSDRYLISRLGAKAPQRATQAFTRLREASTKAWAKFEQTQNADDMFILAEDPALVSALRAAWPNPPEEIATIMRTLEESLAIEAAERAGGMWPYMERRTKWVRDNFAALVKADQRGKILLKMGYNHMIRGANYINKFDVGAMADEVAALTGDRAFHILVLPGPGSRQAVIGKGRSFSSIASDDFDDLQAGNGRLARVLPSADATGHEVIDLRALRPLAMRGLESWNPDVVRTIHGFDAAVIWKGAHASVGLEDSWAP